jgi:hypothetical protein
MNNLDESRLSLVGVIGEGGFGTAALMRDLETNELLVLKT